jgi:hypothetical protein
MVEIVKGDPDTCQDPDTLFQQAPAPPFYSKLTRAVEESKTGRATGSSGRPRSRTRRWHNRR